MSVRVGKEPTPRRRLQYLFFALLILASAPSVLAFSSGHAPLASSPRYNFQNNQLPAAPAARGYVAEPYDEQVGITFTQDFTTLAFNVTAVDQTGPDGDGPAYLLNGLTNVGYWYQVGLSFNWPDMTGQVNQGFSMNYEVFNTFGSSIFPSSGGGITGLIVNPGDAVLLRLSFSTAGNVVMTAKDWNTSSIAQRSYSAEGASTFVGLPYSTEQNGFFTGLMTEEYHSTPYYGAGQPVAYTETSYGLSSAWMWMDEFNIVTNQRVFLAETPSPVVFNNATFLTYFSSNGTAEASGPHGLVTGLTPVKLPSLNTSPVIDARPGQEASITLIIQNPNNVTARVARLTMSGDFGSLKASSGIPFSLAKGNSTLRVTIDLPGTVTDGNHTVTITGDWQFYDSQNEVWIAPQPVETTRILSVTGPSTPPASNPPTSKPPGSGPTTSGSQNPQSSPNSLLVLSRAILLPGILIYGLLILLAIALLAQERKTRGTRPGVSNLTVSQKCGQQASPSMLFCPSCGSPLTIPPLAPDEVHQQSSAQSTGPADNFVS